MSKKHQGHDGKTSCSLTEVVPLKTNERDLKDLPLIGAAQGEWSVFEEDQQMKDKKQCFSSLSLSLFSRRSTMVEAHLERKTTRR